MASTPVEALDLADLHLRVRDMDTTEVQIGDRPASSPGLIKYESGPFAVQRDEDIRLLATLPASDDPKSFITDDSMIEEYSKEARQMLHWIKVEFIIHQKQRARDIQKAKKLRDDTPKTTAYRFATHKSLDRAIKRARVAYERLGAKFKPDDMPAVIKAGMDAINKLDDLLTDDENEVLDALIAEVNKQITANHAYQQCIAKGKQATEPTIQRISVIQKTICTFELRVVMVDVMYAQQEVDAEKGQRPSKMTVQKFLDSDPLIEAAIKLIGDLVEELDLHMKILQEKAMIMEFIFAGNKQCVMRHTLTLKLREALTKGWYFPGDAHEEGQLDAETFRMILEAVMAMDMETSDWSL
ncbi:hypothetical protein ACHAQH_005158 [Verticillium albo-atrum]